MDLKACIGLIEKHPMLKFDDNEACRNYGKIEDNLRNIFKL
jgi:hypothetical protein